MNTSERPLHLHSIGALTDQTRFLGFLLDGDGAYRLESVRMKITTVRMFFCVSALGVTLGVCESPTTTKESDAPTTTKESGKFDSAPGKVADKTFKINDTVSLSDSEWSVVKATDMGSTLKGDEDEGTENKTSEGKFVYVRYRVTNKTKGNEEIIFTPTLQDSKGRNFEQTDDASDYLPKGEKTMDLEQLPSGVPKTFSAIFEVPKDATGLLFLTRSITAVVAPELKAIELGLK